MNELNDTIVAIATAQGEGALGVIRLSGKDSISIANEVFKGKNLLNQASHTIHYGFIVANNKTIDEVIVSIFKAPKSYTTEDSIEISCHGSLYIQEQIVAILIENGARIANPGEFTLRAFLNGRIDLSQAEAVADLIASNSESSKQIALNQLRGGFTNELSQLREELINYASLVELELDFAEEDVDFADKDAMKSLIIKLNNKIEPLISSFKLGNAIKNGINVAIVGKPNAGKSTLLNTLLNEDRAIVSEIAGTTRDTIEEILNIDGIDFRFIDTAGLRETTDEIEKIGVQKALEQVDKSSVYIYLFDMNELSVEEVKNDLKELPSNINRLVIANKSDIASKSSQEAFKNSNLNLIFISAQKEDSILLLKQKLVELIDTENISKQTTIITNLRHYEALTKANDDLKKVQEGLSTGVTGDFLAMDIRQAMHNLGTITGEVSTDDLLGNIFANFCIGK